MTKKIKNIAYSEEEVARYEAKKVKLSARLGVAKGEVTSCQESLDKVEKHLEEMRECRYLQNTKALGEIVLKHFGEMFPQSDSLEMLEYIFEMDEVKAFIAAEKEKLEEAEKAEFDGEATSDDEKVEPIPVESTETFTEDDDDENAHFKESA